MGLGQQRPVALVTGGSRGVGAATVLSLAAGGYDVALVYRNKAARAAEVAAEADRAGAATLALACDITRPEQVAALFGQIGGWRGRIDALVLNASGGLERDLLAADPAYPTRINRDAQLDLLDGALPLLGPGSTVLFVTSHWAHLYGTVEQLPAYEPVARSKHAGERALRDRLPELQRRGIRLLVVTGDLIEGTITPKLLDRAAPGSIEAWRGDASPLPTAAEMGAAIANAVLDPALPDGSVVVVGNRLESLRRL